MVDTDRSRFTDPVLRSLRGMLYCRPYGVRVAAISGNRRKPVCHSALCPHCWARRTIAYWSQLDDLYYPRGSDGKKPKTTTKHLICHIARLNADDREDWKRLVDSRLDRKSGYVPGRFPSRWHAFHSLNRSPALGALEHLGLEVNEEGQRSAVIRQLILLRADLTKIVKKPYALKPPYTFKIYPTPSRRRLAALVSGVFPYPGEFLKNPNLFLEALAVRGSRRLTATMGVLRKKGEK